MAGNKDLNKAAQAKKIGAIICFILTMLGFSIIVPYVGIASIVVGMAFVLYA